MTRVIVSTMGKGGSTKTTSIVTLGTGLFLKGQRVLMIGLDPQCDMEVHLGIDVDHLPRLQVYNRAMELETRSKSINTLLTAPPVNNPYNMIIHLSFEEYRDAFSIPEGLTLDVIAADRDLDATDRTMQAINMHLIKPIVEVLSPHYDYILIDTRRADSYLTLGALCEATDALLPLDTEYLSMRNLPATLEMIANIRASANRDLHLLGILYTKARLNTKLAENVIGETQEILKKLAEQDPTKFQDFLDKILPFRVRHTIRYSEASALGVPIQFYDNPDAQKYARDYQPLIDLVLGGEA